MNLGSVSTGSTVRIPFNTFSGVGASVTVTNLAAGDVKIHKDGSATERASASGVTVSIDFDSITGNHYIIIDLSDDTDAGFYTADSVYDVRLEGITVDSQTLNLWVGRFRISAKPHVDDLNDLSSANVTAAVPTVNQILAGLNAGTYDGKTFTELMTAIRGLGFGNIAVTDNGDTYTVILYAADGTTPIATFTTDQTTGARTIV